MLEQNPEASMLFYSFLRNCMVKGLIFNQNENLPNGYQCDDFNFLQLPLTDGLKVDPCVDLVSCLPNQQLSFTNNHNSPSLLDDLDFITSTSYAGYPFQSSKYPNDTDCFNTSRTPTIFDNHNINLIDFGFDQIEKIWMLENDLENRTELLIKRIKRLQTKQLEKHIKEQLQLFVQKQNNTSYCQSLRTTVGVLTTNLKHLESSYDSDATESSSGGESCDEFENVIANSLPSFSRPDTNSNPLAPIQRKSNWKWLNERSAIASRWTWLQAQVADLEFKIRQQNEMYRQLRASKGSIAFYCKETPTSCINNSLSATVPNCLNKVSIPSSSQTPSLTTATNTVESATLTTTTTSTTTPSTTPTTTLVSSSTTTVTTPSTCALTSNTSSAPATKDSTSEDKDVANPEKEIYHCARTLPLKQMRKRKLVRSCNALAGATRKIARYSTVLCSCTNYPRFVSPCVLCNGRYSHLQMIDTDCMPNYERYALLDPSYHPVLSLPNANMGKFLGILSGRSQHKTFKILTEQNTTSLDHNQHQINTINYVALGVYFSKILKKETVQKAIPSKHPHKRRSNHSGEFSFKFGSDGKKINRRKSQAIISSTKLKKKYDGTTKKKFAKGNHGYGKRSLREKNDHTNGSGDETRTESPSPSPLSSENSSVPIHRRRRSEQYAYDINNIVIPYSIASTTRVEKLKYKEIITPKWRYVEVNNNLCLHEETEETDEDTSDEMFAVRHLRCEIDERKQFSSYLRNPSGAGPGRGRGARTRLDSARSDGGGKNTVNIAGKISKNSKNNNNLTQEGHINPNLNESTQNVDLSSQDSLVTAPINLNMNSNNISDSLPTKQITTSITLPVTTTPTTPTPPTPLPINCNAVDSICDSETLTTHGPPAKTTIRHRTSSSSKREDSVEEDSYIEVQPYEKRQFPINDHEYEEMLRITMESMRDDDVSEEGKCNVKPEVNDENSKDDTTTATEAKVTIKEGEDGKRSWRISQNCDDSLISDGDNANATFTSNNSNSRAKSGKVSRCSSSTSSSVVANGVDTDEDDGTDPEWEPGKATKDIKL